MTLSEKAGTRLKELIFKNYKVDQYIKRKKNLKILNSNTILKFSVDFTIHYSIDSENYERTVYRHIRRINQISIIKKYAEFFNIDYRYVILDGQYDRLPYKTLDKNSYMNNGGIKLYSLMEKNNVSSSELAKVLNCTDRTIRNYCFLGIDNLDMIEKICTYFNCDISNFFI